MQHCKGIWLVGNLLLGTPFLKLGSEKLCVLSCVALLPPLSSNYCNSKCQRQGNRIWGPRTKREKETSGSEAQAEKKNRRKPLWDCECSGSSVMQQAAGRTWPGWPVLAWRYIIGAISIVYEMTILLCVGSVALCCASCGESDDTLQVL